MFGIAWAKIISITVMVVGARGLARVFQITRKLWQDVMMVFCGPHQHAAGGRAPAPHPLARGRLCPGREGSARLQIRHAGALGKHVQCIASSTAVISRLLAHCRHSPKFAASRRAGPFYNEEDNAEARNMLFFSAATRKSSSLRNSKPLARRSH